ncbi:MAG: hypothetical protein LJE69_11025 [Thiohalocapsa sp.]|uniref:sensor histidine kinase n=1 Tax=Thiohalocapsa sp. TaxID=2497641 RepID=UPI0026002821|nr:ATP-binding protein [Thiohalocapsa sp.]MCG6941766.1 hypothetical protein [Thiohalocapsa sp.]
MQRQLAQLVRLVDDLLDLNRIDHGRILLRRERVAVADVLEQAIETTRSLIDSRGHRLTLDLPAATLALDADPVRLGQVFANLLSNAAKYTEPGGSIAVQVTRAGGDCIVQVKDDGVGIPQALLPRGD